MVCDGAGTPAARPGGVRCSLICAAASCRHYLYSAGVGDLSTARASTCGSNQPHLLLSLHALSADKTNDSPITDWSSELNDLFKLRLIEADSFIDSSDVTLIICVGNASVSLQVGTTCKRHTVGSTNWLVDDCSKIGEALNPRFLRRYFPI